MSDVLNRLIKDGGLFKPSANPLPAPSGVSEQEQERFYAQALGLMVREQLRPGLARARAGAKVPLHKVAMQLQMGRPVDSGQERALALADMRAVQFHWDVLGRAEDKARRTTHWLQAAEALLAIRSAVHDASRGPQPMLVQPLLNLLDAWHNVPLLIAQRGVSSVNPQRVGSDARLWSQWERWVEIKREALSSGEEQPATTPEPAQENTRSGHAELLDSAKNLATPRSGRLGARSR